MHVSCRVLDFDVSQIPKLTLDIPDTSLAITRERAEEFARSLRIAAAEIGCNRVELVEHLHSILGNR